MILFFDFETNGLIDPLPVELGAVLVHKTVELAVVSLVIRPDGWVVSSGAEKVHGVSTEAALSCGVPLIVAMSALTNLWSLAELRVAHNLEFDDKVADRAFQLLGRGSTLKRPPGACTAELATPVLNLPPTVKMLAAGFDKPKRPSLKECYQHFFGESVPGAHGALADARACARVYMKLTEATQ